MLDPGKRRVPIRIEERSSTLDGAGEPEVVWNLVLTTQAAVERGTGREVWSSNERSGRVPTFFNIRFRPDVTIRPRMRLTSGTTLYDIKSVADRDGMRAELILTCEELVEEPIE